MTENERLTHKRMNGIKSGYWSPAKKDELVQRLGKYEDTGMEPEGLRKAGKWIPVEERLPEEDEGEVIVTDRNGNVWAGMYYGYAADGGEEHEGRCFYQWDDEMWHCFKPDVIAWRPLPEPYKPN